VVSDHGKGTTPNGTQEENVGQCSTPISPTDASNKGNVSLNVIDSPTIDLIKPGPISGPTSYVREVIDLRVDEELKDSIMMAMLKLIGEGFNMCTVCVNYEWKPPRCSSCKVFGHVLNECLKKIILDVVKNLNNPRQATRGVLVVPKIDKLQRQILDGKFMFVDDDENPPVPTVNVHSESEVEV
ncbi:hypothetical protein Tco_1519951, partial [Tanacetum coccineum]